MPRNLPFGWGLVLVLGLGLALALALGSGLGLGAHQEPVVDDEQNRLWPQHVYLPPHGGLRYLRT